MLLSVIIPVYRVERTIERCLRSVLTQEAAGWDVECVVVDDASPDQSMALARREVEAPRAEGRCRLLAHSVNRGLSAARNTGIEAARGDWLLFVDSDDHLPPRAVARLTEAAARHPRADVVAGNFQPGSALRFGPGQVPEYTEDWAVYLPLLLRETISSSACNKLYRRSLLDGGARFAEGYIHEDTMLNYTLFHHLRGVASVAETTYVYEDNPQGIMRAEAGRSQRAMDSVNHLARLMTDDTDRRAEVDKHMRLLNLLLRAESWARRPGAAFSAESRAELRRNRRRLTLRALRRGEWPLVLCDMAIHEPLVRLVGCAAFRRHHDGVWRCLAAAARRTERKREGRP